MDVNPAMDGRPTTPWWHPDAIAARRPHLAARQAILAWLRADFAACGFDEVETPALQVSPGPEPHLRSFATLIEEPFADEPPRALFLHASPELAMKKLMAGGLTRLYQLARVFRNGERSPLHHPEFTMLEWYRAGAGIEALMEDCERILRGALAAAGRDRPMWQGEGCDVDGPFERLSVAEAFLRHTGIDVLANVGDSAALAAEAARIGVRTGGQDDWEDVFFRILLDRIEPHLGMSRPTFLTHYPAPLAALARTDPADPRVALRFELFVRGVELANGFDELTDPAEQRRRLVVDRARKIALYGMAEPIDEDFLAALDAGMPQAAGIALGFDRLVMLASGATRIEDVLWAPVAG